MLVATYDIQPEDHEDFFNAYIDALQNAFLAYVVDGKDAIALINELYEQSLKEVYDVSIESSS